MFFCLVNRHKNIKKLMGVGLPLEDWQVVFYIIIIIVVVLKRVSSSVLMV